MEVIDNVDFWIELDSISDLKHFMTKMIDPGDFVMMATFDDAATHLDDDARDIIASFGSKRIHELTFRDNWVFLGSNGPLEQFEPFEELMPNLKVDSNQAFLKELRCVSPRHTPVKHILCTFFINCSNRKSIDKKGNRVVG